MTNGLLKSLAVAALVALFSAGSLIAADNEVNASSDTTKNPITGTVKQTKKFKKKSKNADGSTTTKDSKDVVKEKTDGTTEKSSSSETTTTPN